MTDTTSATPPKAVTIDQIKLAVVAAASLATIVAGILSDGKVGIWEVVASSGSIFSAMSKLAHLSGPEILTEIEALDDAGKSELNQLFKDNFHLANASVEAMIDQGVQYLLDAVDGIHSLLAIRKS